METVAKVNSLLCGAAMLPVSLVAPITTLHKIFDRNTTNVPIETLQTRFQFVSQAAQKDEQSTRQGE